MLGKITTELSKLIAQDIYTAAKKIPNALSSLKHTGIKQNGNGLPPNITNEFGKTFELAMIANINPDGFVKYQDGKVESCFKFRLVSTVVSYVQNKCNWRNAANAATTQAGVKLQAALGSNYETCLNSIVPQLVALAIAELEGQYHRGNIGWRILTKAVSDNVAKRGTTNFAPHHIYYLAIGNEEDTKHTYRQAKKYLHKGFFKRKYRPSEGPYFN